ncbi:MAG: thiamine pyrophosphate-dependent enzyme, partial [Pseudomonadota bacterium]
GARPVGPALDSSAVAAIAKQLTSANRPILLAGGGGWTDRDRAALHEFSTQTGVPVMSTFRNHDLFDNTHPNFVGEAGVGMAPGVKETLATADCIVAVNARFGEMTTGTYTLFQADRADQWIAHIHKSADEFGKVVQADLTCVAEPQSVLTPLADMVAPASARSDWTHQARRRFEDSQSVGPQPGTVDMGQVTGHIAQMLHDDAIITHGAGNFAIWPNKFLQYGPNMRLIAPQSGAMGYGVPAAVAAKIECPERQVICFAGDGDFQMTCPELGTALQAGVGPVILVVNNGTYGTIRMHQERAYPGRVSGTDLVNPDFAGLARAYGFLGETVTKTADFQAAFARALAAPQGAVLDLHVSKNAITPRLTLQQLQALGG